MEWERVDLKVMKPERETTWKCIEDRQKDRNRKQMYKKRKTANDTYHSLSVHLLW